MAKLHVLKSLGLILLLSNWFQPSAQAQNLKKMDRKKWQELVKEVKSKRYDPKEKKPEYDQDFIEDLNTQNDDYEMGEYNDEGIYNENENDFFNENNDRMGNGEGKNQWNESDLEDIDPKYNDFEDGGGNGNGTNEGSGKYNKYNDGSNNDYYSKKNNEPLRTTQSSSSSSGGDNTWLLIVMIVLVSAALIYMIVVSFNDRNKKTKVIESTESKLENLTITKSELELALEAALRDKNYREAVRIYFIAVIKEMKDRKWIKWEKKKTNYHYIHEINGRQQQPDFITATRVFEIVWYGNREMAVTDYNQVEPVFKNLIKSINA